MRHRKDGVKLNRTSSHRQAMFRNMVTSLLKHEQIRTTDVKAKELRRWADHIITLAKRGDLHARRQAMAIVREKTVVHKLFEEAQQRFGQINGGYTRIVKLGRRPGDAAPVSLIELITVAQQDKKGKKKAKPAAKKKGAASAKAADKKISESKGEKKAAQQKQDDIAPQEAQELAPEASVADGGADEDQQSAQSDTVDAQQAQGDDVKAKAEAKTADEEQAADEHVPPKDEKSDK